MVESSEQGERESEGGRGVASAARVLLASASATFAAHKAEAFAAALLLLMAANCLTVNARKSVTNDENIHIPAGYYHLVVGDFQFNNPHPPPPKMLGALPLLFIQPDEMSEDRRDDLKNEDDFERAAINHFWASRRSRSSRWSRSRPSSSRERWLSSSSRRARVSRDARRSLTSRRSLRSRSSSSTPPTSSRTARSRSRTLSG